MPDTMSSAHELKKLDVRDLSCGRLFDEVPCYISIQDRALGVVEANRKLIEDFGNPIFRKCYDLYKKRSEPCPECPVVRTLSDGKEHTSEETIVDRHGQQHHVVVNTMPLRDKHGDVVAVMEMFTDITEVKELQDKLAFLGKLVAGTAHSVKNILEGLRGGVYVVNMGFKTNTQADIKTGWEMVERNVQRVSAMIMDMLYCAKDRTPNPVPLDLRAMASEIVSLYFQRAADSGAELNLELDPKLPPVPGEPKDIHALLSNLVTNAIDACAACEEERRFRVSLRVYQDNDKAVIEVADNGAGMDAETRDRLFTMFFSTKGSSGTGLGLLVSHKVVSEHGGSIHVASEPGHGATFTVRLPLSAASISTISDSQSSNS